MDTIQAQFIYQGEAKTKQFDMEDYLRLVELMKNPQNSSLVNWLMENPEYIQTAYDLYGG